MQPAKLTLNSQFSTFNSKKGFTLIELLVVITILGILASMAFALLNPVVIFGRGRDAKRKTDLKEIAKSLQLYYSDKKVYPASTGFTAVASTLNTPLVPTYIKSLPTDPVNSNNNVYMYRTNSAAEGTCGVNQDYVLRAVLERAEDPQAYHTDGTGKPVPTWCGSSTATVDGSPLNGSVYATPN